MSNKQEDTLRDLMEFCQKYDVNVTIKYSKLEDGFIFRVHDDTVDNCLNHIFSQSQLDATSTFFSGVGNQIIYWLKNEAVKLLKLNEPLLARKMNKFVEENCPDEYVFNTPYGQVKLIGEDAKKYWEEHHKK